MKKNQVLLLVWLILLGYATGLLAEEYGIRYLFMAPEYFNQIDHKSFFLLGVATGIFFMAFNITSYVVSGYLFPFIATISRPFVRFTLNNFSLPLFFVVIYGISSYNYQIEMEFIEKEQVAINLFAFYAGVFLFVFFSFTYFFSANIDIFRLAGLKRKQAGIRNLKPIQKLLQKDAQWKMQNIPLENYSHWFVGHYLSSPFRIRQTKDYRHYSPGMIQKVLSQNNKNAVYYSIFIILMIIGLGFSIESSFLLIPAAASITLLLALILLVTGAFYSIFKEWSLLFFLVIVFGLNELSKTSIFTYQQSAYGLSYKKNQDTVVEYTKSDFDSDKKEMEDILSRWRYKNRNKYAENKPKIILVNTSGGGLKAALWTYHSMGYADSITNGRFLDHTFLITGASGGMLGASYLRELYAQYKAQKIAHFYQDSLADNLGKDLLNPVAFSIATHDWFFRIQKFEYKNKQYYIDRASLFEKYLNQNTHNILDKSLCEYRKIEQSAQVPLIILTPAVVNYGGQLVISPNNVSFLCRSKQLNITAMSDMSPIEFRRHYADYQADSLRFTTAIRMNASFPYIAPVVELPGRDHIKVMDAGVHDNYGMSTSLNFAHEFTDWINKYTSGVIVVQITEINNHKIGSEGILNQLFKPLSGVFDNFFNFQQIKIEKNASILDKNLKIPVHYVNFYLKSHSDGISLSWHLTEKEKISIKEALMFKQNQIAMKNLQVLLNVKEK